MAILEHDAFMSDELRRVPLKELTNRLDSFRRVMTERDPAWKMAVITDKIDMYYFAGTMQDGAFIIRPVMPSSGFGGALPGPKMNLSCRNPCFAACTVFASQQSFTEKIYRLSSIWITSIPALNGWDSSRSIFP